MKVNKTSKVAPHTGSLPDYLASKAESVEDTTAVYGQELETSKQVSAEQQVVSTGETVKPAEQTKGVSEPEIDVQTDQRFYKKAQVRVRHFRAKIEE